MNTNFALSVALLGFIYRPVHGNLDNNTIRKYCEDFFGDDGLSLWKQDFCTISCRYENSLLTVYCEDGSDCSPGNGTHACWKKTCRRLSRFGRNVCGPMSTNMAFVVTNNPCLVQCGATDGTLGAPVSVPNGSKCLYYQRYRGECKNGECHKVYLDLK